MTLLGYVLTSIGWYEEQSGRGTADEIASMINPASAAAPTETLLALLLVTAVGAPVLEEVVFRGFLLPSLNRYMNDHLAIAIVSLAFAASHQSGTSSSTCVEFLLLVCMSFSVHVRTTCVEYSNPFQRNATKIIIAPCWCPTGV